MAASPPNSLRRYVRACHLYSFLFALRFFFTLFFCLLTAELVAQLQRLGFPGLGPRALSKKTKALASLFALEAATGAKVQVLSPVRMRLSDVSTKSAEGGESYFMYRTFHANHAHNLTRSP